jgi:hypothetical protein
MDMVSVNGASRMGQRTPPTCCNQAPYPPPLAQTGCCEKHLPCPAVDITLSDLIAHQSHPLALLNLRTRWMVSPMAWALQGLMIKDVAKGNTAGLTTAATDAVPTKRKTIFKSLFPRRALKYLA